MSHIILGLASLFFEDFLELAAKSAENTKVMDWQRRKPLMERRVSEIRQLYQGLAAYNLGNWPLRGVQTPAVNRITEIMLVVNSSERL
jgi:hypothetical protein